MATVEQLHMMRMEAKKLKKKNTPLARELELRREEMVNGILKNLPAIINQQLKLAGLKVVPGGKDNDIVFRASNALLDRSLGKPKETVDFNGSVKFSLIELARKADLLELE